MYVCDGIDVLTVSRLTPHLRMCKISNIAEDIVPATAAELCAHWTSMEVLELFRRMYGPICSEEALLVFVQSCPTLTSIRLMESMIDPVRRHYRITQPPPLPSDSQGSRLLELQAPWVGAATLQTIIDSCPRLCALHLFYPPNTDHNNAPLTMLHSTAVKTLVVEGANLDDLELLTIRNMEHLYLVNFRGFVSCLGLAAMAHQNPNLKSFVMSGNSHVVHYRSMIAQLDASPKLETFVLRSDDANRTDTPTHRALNEVIRHNYRSLRTVDMAL